MLTLQTSFNPLLLKRGGGVGKPLVEVTVNSKEFCPNYVQEIGLTKNCSLWVKLLQPKVPRKYLYI
jgi:hypothetical protein